MDGKFFFRPLPKKAVNTSKERNYLSVGGVGIVLVETYKVLFIGDAKIGHLSLKTESDARVV